MRNLKKLFALVVVFAMLVTVSVPAFAAASFSYEAEAQTLNDLGLYNGISNDTFDPDLGAALNRETGVVMLLRIFGLEAEAEALSAAEVDATLGQFKDAAAIADWAKASVAYAVSNGLVNGLPDGTFAPKANLVGKAYCTLILRQLGYTPNYDTAAAELADAGGLTTSQAIIFSGKALIKDDLVGISYGALSAVDTDGVSVIASLVANDVVDAAVAADAGLLDAEIAASADAAVAAYEAAPITTLDEITAAEALGVAAADAVALLADSAEKGALQAKVGTQDAKVAAAKASLTALSATAVQSGAKTIKVTFSRALTAEEQTAATITLKKGLVPYSVTTTFSAEATTAVVAYAYNIPAGTYTLTIGGVEKSITVAAVAPVVSKIVIADESYMIGAATDINYDVYSQFDEEITPVTGTITVKAYNATDASEVVVTSGAMNLAAAEKADNIIVTVSHSTTGIIASKTVPVIAAAAVTTLGFDAVQPLEDETRITVGDEGLVLPYTFKDQYGAAFTLGEHTAGVEVPVNADTETINGILFISSDADVVNPDTFAVDEDGVLTFDAGDDDGTAIITALVPSTGASATISIKVEAVAGLGSFLMDGPTALVVAGETAEVKFTATDSFDAPIALADFEDYSAAVSFVSSNDAVINDATDIVFNAKTNKLEVTPTADGTATIYAYVDGALQNSVSIEVNDVAVPTKLVGLTDVPTLFQEAATTTIDVDNLVMIDQYNRAIDELGSSSVTVAKDDTDDSYVNITGGVATITDAAEVTLTGADAGSQKYIFTLTDADADTDDSEYDVTFKVIETTDIKSYAFDTVGTLLAGAAYTEASDYAVDLTLVGKDSSGKEVNLVVAEIVTALTSSDTAIVRTYYNAGTMTIYAIDDGTATVAAWKGATKIAEVSVTSKDSASVPATAEFDSDGTYEAAIGSTLDLVAAVDPLLTIEDQYGVAIAEGVYTGVWASSDTSIATVSATGVVTGVDEGTATISFVTSNGVVITVDVDVFAITPASATFSPDTRTITGAAGTTFDLKTVLTVVDQYGANATTKAGTWAIVSGSSVTVNAGVVTTVAAGDTTVSFTTAAGNKSDTIVVTVAAVPTAAVVTPATATVAVSGTTTLTVSFVDQFGAAIVPADTTGTWSSGDTDIATVSAAGVVTGVAAGPATITFAPTTATIAADTTAVTVQ